VGDLTAVIGDNEDYQGRRAGYNGIHRLTHRTNPNSLFTVTGLNLEHIFDGDQDLRGDAKILFEPRNFPMTLTRISDSEAELHQEETPTFHLESWTRFKIVAPHYIDVTFRCKPYQHVFKHGYIGLFWASYIDAPENKSIYFRDAKGWVQLCTQAHANQSTVVPVDNKVELKFTPKTREMLYNNFSPLRFQRSRLLRAVRDAPIYRHVRSVGRDPVRPFAERRRAAVGDRGRLGLAVHHPDVRRAPEYGYRARVVYRERCSRAEVLNELRTWKASLKETPR